MGKLSGQQIPLQKDVQHPYFQVIENKHTETVFCWPDTRTLYISYSPKRLSHSPFQKKRDLVSTSLVLHGKVGRRELEWSPGWLSGFLCPVAK